MPDTPHPHRAEIVIVGGGIVGCSTASHSTMLGRRDVLLLEQGRGKTRSNAIQPPAQRGGGAP